MISAASARMDVDEPAPPAATMLGPQHASEPENAGRRLRVVHPEARELDLYREPTSVGYKSRTTLREGDLLHAVALLGLEFTVSDIFPPRP